MAQLILTDSQDCVLTVTAKSRKDNDAMLQNPTWESSDSTVLTVTQDASDPLKAVASAVDAGTVVVTFRADADLSDGVVEIIGTMDVVVGPGMASVISIAAGTPTEQP